MLAGGGEVVDAGVAVAVRDVQCAVERDFHIGGSVEGVSAHRLGRLVRGSERHDEVAFSGPLADGMITHVGGVHTAIGSDGQMVR